MNKKDTIIFDLDDTLFNTASVKQDFFEIMATSGIAFDVVHDTYLALRKKSPIYNLQQHVALLYQETGIKISDDIIEQLQNMSYEKYVDEDTKKLLSSLRDEYTLWLLSLGNYETQMKKLSDSGLIHYFDEEKIIITEEPKENELQKLSLEEPVYFVNDKIGETEIVAEQFPKFTCIIVGENVDTSLRTISHVRDLKKIL